MLVPTLLAALAALPAITAQSTSTVASTSTDCFTRFGFYPLPTGTNAAAIPTWYSFAASTNTINIVVTTQSTVTVTPSATTFTNVATISTVVTTTTTSTPPPSSVGTPSGFAPLLLVNLAAPTPRPAVSRIKRLQLNGRSDEVTHPLKRQTAPGNTGGYIAYPNGTYSGLYRRYPHRVDCRIVVTYDETITNVVVGDPVTSFAQQQTVTDATTVTSTSTTTVTAVVPAETIYAACAVNNVVNQVTDVNGSTMYFERVVYRPEEGFPVANELIMATPDPVECCVQCQRTPFCAGSFYAAGISECHLRLTQPYAPTAAVLPPSLPSGIFQGNADNATLIMATGGSSTTTGLSLPSSTGTPGGNTCSAGSMSRYLGTIRGKNDFPEQFALWMSNGPCGRYSISPIALREPMQS